MNYAQQLKHPNWQRKRLEALQAADFECANCGEKESMLHVHHKRYVKGRMAWEYKIEELMVLCEACHEEWHFMKDRLDRLFADGDQRGIVSLVAGYSAEAYPDLGMVEECRQAGSRVPFIAGTVAACLEGCDPSKMQRVVEFVLGAGIPMHPVTRYALEDALEELRKP